MEGEAATMCATGGDESVLSSRGGEVPVVAFWCLGLLNNTPYVIMLASAKSISQGGTALVYIANIVPGLLVKLSSPYWFDVVPYEHRMAVASILMATAFCIVALFSLHNDDNDDNNPTRQQRDMSDTTTVTSNVILQLIGVALASAQCSLGEASLLALAGKFDSSQQQPQQQQQTSKKCITAFSSGTGIAGVVGYAYKVLLTDVFGGTLRFMLCSANGLAISYWLVYYYHVLPIQQPPPPPPPPQEVQARFQKMNGVPSSFRLFDTNTRDDKMMYTTLNNNDHSTKNDNCVNKEYHDNNNNSSSLLLLGDDTTVSSTNIPEKLQTTTNNDTTTNTSNDTMMELHKLSNHDSSSWNKERRRQHSISTSTHHKKGETNEFSPLQQQQQRRDTTDEEDANPIIQRMTCYQRFTSTISLWPFMVPLFSVYAFEYAIQSGVWTSIGVPIQRQRARDWFYEYSNWTYQCGVFVSRSSGTLFTTPLSILWLMPALQLINLIFFYMVAATQQYQYPIHSAKVLLPICFYVGLLGGAVYVNGYARICSDLPISIREFALSTASVADGLGVLVADIAGLFIQACLYKRNGLDGAIVLCPIR